MSFRQRAQSALSDSHAQKTFRKAAKTFKDGRDEAFASLPEAEDVRDEVAAIRRQSLDRVYDLLNRLERELTARGGMVARAATAAEACDMVLDIARQAGVQRVVKGKSMVTEEIRLNDALIREGMQVTETDLGEFIIQLVGQGPSHMIAPAIHLSKEQVGDIFHEHLGEAVETDIPKLTRIARKHLRQRFLQADMGITGVNAAIAETGTLMLVENEGNIRISGTAPRVHVAIMTMEKVVERAEEAAAILELLPRSAAGQVLPGYVSFFTGPRRADEFDGPQALHLIILDNGRSRLLNDPKLREVLACVRCGACLNVCPVWSKAGGHAYGGVYSGPIGSLLTPLLNLTTDGWELPFACTQCGACAEVCPAKIDHPNLLLELRRRALPRRPRTAMRLFAWAATNPALWRAGFALMRGLDPRLARVSRVPGLGARVQAWSARRALPRLERPFSARANTGNKEAGNA